MKDELDGEDKEDIKKAEIMENIKPGKGKFARIFLVGDSVLILLQKPRNDRDLLPNPKSSRNQSRRK